MIDSNGVSNIKLVLEASVMYASPVVTSFELLWTLAAKDKDDPDFTEIDSATLKSDSIEYVFEAGINGNAWESVIVWATLLDCEIKIGARNSPAPSVTLKYMLA